MKNKFLGIVLVFLGIVLVVVLVIATLRLFFPQVKTLVGSVPTLDGITSPYMKINEVETAFVSQPINATSTMLCNIPNPYTSTSTLKTFSVRITSGILGANAYSVSTSSTYYGSSTPVLVLDHNIPTGSTDSMRWFPSSATTTSRVLPGINSTTGESNIYLKKGEFLVVRLATTTGAGALAAYYKGQCSAEFQRE